MRKFRTFAKTVCILMLCVVLVAGVILFAGCRKFPYKLLHGQDQISRIQLAIIKFGNGNTSSDDVAVNVLKDIEDTELFMQEFTEIEFVWYLPIGDPYTLRDDEMVILITYNNGDYDAISYYAQCNMKNGEFSQNFTRNLWCDEDTFVNFFNKWFDK